MKTKIVNFLYHPPPYHLLNEGEQFTYTWQNSKSQWLGMSGKEWPDLLGEEVMKLTDEFEYEVWQPDLRADKIYQKSLPNGTVHKLFPSERNKVLLGLKPTEVVLSKRIFKSLSDISRSNRVILHINSIINYFGYRILKEFDLPTLVQFHSKTTWPPREKYRIRKNLLKNFYYYSIERLLKRREVAFVYSNSVIGKPEFESLTPTVIARIFMGVDFSKFNKSDNSSRNNKTFSMASRFVRIKQIDKVIKVFDELDEKGYDFELIIAGHGNRDYEDTLKTIGANLIDKGKLLFPGYLDGKDLHELYGRSDLFISSSKAEGGPVSVMKAIAMDTPVMCTRVGGVDDILAENDAGILVDPFDYEEWKEELIKILEGKNVPVLDRDVAKKHFHWPNIAEKFIEVYRAFD